MNSGGKHPNEMIYFSTRDRSQEPNAPSLKTHSVVFSGVHPIVLVGMSISLEDHDTFKCN